MKVVFTGPAFDNSGHSVVRADLIAACVSTGKFTVQSSVKADTDMVVASRTDTRKAKGAAARGLLVLSYPTFIRSFLSDLVLKSGAQPSKYTDKIDLDLLVPDFGPYSTEEVDIL